MAVLLFIEQRQGRDWLFWAVQHCLKKRDQMISQPLNGLCLKNICVVLKHQAEKICRFTKRDLQIHRRRLAINAKHAELKPRKLNLPFRKTRRLLHWAFRADIEIFDLVERHAAHVSLNLEPIHQMPKWIFLIGESAEASGAN